MKQEMNKRYVAHLNGQYRMASKTLYNDVQIEDIRWMLGQWGNMILRIAKSDPKLLEEIELPEVDPEVLA